MSKTVALIPLRGGSKTIPDKNIRQIAGKPLCAWALEAACASGLFEVVYVSTDSDRIAGVVKSLGLDVTIIDRPDHLATDDASTESVMLHLAGLVDFDLLVTMQATSPLVTPDDLLSAMKKFREEKLDSLLTGVRLKRFFWSDLGVPLNYNHMKRPMRQQFNGTIMENGAFYVTSRAVLEEQKSRLGGKIGIYEMAIETATEIDNPEDWAIVESLLKKRNKKEILKKLKDVKLLAFDCDGVLTDGSMYYSESGDELKKFSTRDGQGLELAREKGIISALITKEDSNAARRRGEKMKVNDIFIGIKDKAIPIKQLMQKYKLKHDNIAYIGDDIGDILSMKKVGVSFAVKDAVQLVKDNADYILNSSGGRGCLREVCDLILKNK